MAARAVRHQIYEADEALQSGTAVGDIVQNQKSFLELQLQQLLGEYGHAQEIIEAGRVRREANEEGAKVPKQRHQVGNQRFGSVHGNSIAYIIAYIYIYTA